jgi:DNA-binding MarR family transcriptional regulator
MQPRAASSTKLSESRGTMKVGAQRPLGGPGEMLPENWFTSIVDLDRVISRSADQQLKRLLGISFTQAKAIIFLASQHCLTPAQLGHRLNHDLGSVSRLVSRLVEAGIALKAPHSHDRRCWCISLTGRGAEMVGAIVTILAGIEDRLTVTLADDEAHCFVALLKRLFVNATILPGTSNALPTG